MLKLDRGETGGKAAMRRYDEAWREMRNRRMGLTKCDIHFSRGVTFATETRERITRAEYVQPVYNIQTSLIPSCSIKEITVDLARSKF